MCTRKTKPALAIRSAQIHNQTHPSTYAKLALPSPVAQDAICLDREKTPRNANAAWYAINQTPK